MAGFFSKKQYAVIIRQGIGNEIVERTMSGVSSRPVKIMINIRMSNGMYMQ